MPQAQAVAGAEALRDVLSESLDTMVATKTDIVGLKGEMSALRHELSCQVTRLDAKMDTKFAIVDARFDKSHWMLGMLIALNVANFARQFF